MNWLLLTAVFAGLMAGDVAVEVFAETTASSFLQASDNWFWSFPTDPTSSDAALAAERTLNEDEYLRQLCSPTGPLSASATLR